MPLTDVPAVTSPKPIPGMPILRFVSSIGMRALTVTMVLLFGAGVGIIAVFAAAPDKGGVAATFIDTAPLIGFVGGMLSALGLAATLAEHNHHEPAIRTHARRLGGALVIVLGVAVLMLSVTMARESNKVHVSPTAPAGYPHLERS